MNLDLRELLENFGATISSLSKSEKVKTFSRWNKAFPGLIQAARHGRRVPGVEYDQAADIHYGQLRDEEFYVLPDDRSGMPSYRCRVESMPDLRELVSDTITDCDELVILDSDLRWSMVLVNHGSAELVGRYFQFQSDSTRANSSSS